MTNSSRWTKHQRDVCRALYEDGADLPTMAKAVRRPEAAVQQWLRRQFASLRMVPLASDPTAARFAPFTSAETSALIERTKRGYSYSQLAHETGRSAEFMSCWLRRGSLADPYDFTGRAAPTEWGCDEGVPRHESKRSWDYCSRTLLERLQMFHIGRQRRMGATA